MPQPHLTKTPRCGQWLLRLGLGWIVRRNKTLIHNLLRTIPHIYTYIHTSIPSTPARVSRYLNPGSKRAQVCMYTVGMHACNLSELAGQFTATQPTYLTHPDWWIGGLGLGSSSPRFPPSSSASLGIFLSRYRRCLPIIYRGQLVISMYISKEAVYVRTYIPRSFHVCSPSAVSKTMRCPVHATCPYLSQHICYLCMRRCSLMAIVCQAAVVLLLQPAEPPRGRL
ncbi:hypothetical protein GGR51DRAFT_525435, partial [Nemania sp. FL0031]